jgi:hypothetical protein
MLPRFTRASLSLLALSALAAAAAPGCGDDDPATSGPGGGGGGGGGGTTSSGGECQLERTTFDEGDPVGHPDPFGARAAGQARAGRVDTIDDAWQPAHGRQKLESGDVVLANDRLALWIEAAGQSDGYNRFGGAVVAVDGVGEDGQPLGLSTHLETVLGLSMYVPETRSVTILNDGSDGEAAVVRVVGPLRALAFLSETFSGLFPEYYDGLEVAHDFVLEPGADSVLVRFSIINSSPYEIDAGVDVVTNDAFLGFFQYSQNDMATDGDGFGDPSGETPYFAFEGRAGWGFGYVDAEGEPLEYSGIEKSGFSLAFGQGFKMPACAETTVDHVRIVSGGPYYDGLREAIRRVRGEEAWRAIDGTVQDAEGEPVAGAWVHVLGADGRYLSRTRAGDDGAFTVHAPDEQVTVVASERGFPAHEGEQVAPDDDAVTVQLGPTGTLHVVATQEGEGRRIPVRVQVIPTEPQPPTPAAFGLQDEANGRLWQEFAVTGEATLRVPPGEHRVIVTRGTEWELHDETIDVAAGETVEVAAALAHSVDTTGVLCADYHIHSFYSNDSSDPIVHKLKGAVADGLDIPVSSEHEWIADFQPIIEELGLDEWAFGVPSEELTTFTWGHFGVVPAQPQPGAYHNGAADWVGKQPKEVFALVDQMPGEPMLIVNHPVGTTAFSSYFTAADLDPDTGTSDHPLWDENFDAIEVFNDSDFESNRDEVVRHWFALLNRGLKKVAVGSSDSHHIRTSPVGYPRTCLLLGTDDPRTIDAIDVRDVTKAGHSTISGGLFMTVEGPGGAIPGDTLPSTDTASFVVTVEAPSWLEASTLEVIVNGETVATEDLLPIGAGPSNRYVNEIEVDLPDGHGWVVFHAKGTGDLTPLHSGRGAFAVSNPVWFE